MSGIPLRTINRALAGIALFTIAHVAAAAERVALVIGNGEYEHTLKLTNPIHDARDLGGKLTAGGWEVTLVENASVLQMLRSVREFCGKARGAEAALVFYAGHGIEVNGKNYLLPVDAELAEEHGEDALALETLQVDKLIADLGGSGARLKVIVLDACRNNPLSRSWLSSRSAGGGMAEVSESALAEGTMLVFSTSPGKVAADGRGRNSPFTTALLERMQKGGGIADVFGDTAVSMGARQEAWLRFDGSGRSFVAFRAYEFVPGLVTPEKAAPVTATAPVVVTLPEVAFLPAADETQRADFLKLLKRALEGDAEAQAETGHIYGQGILVREDDEEALRWLRMGAAQGNGKAQNYLGEIYNEDQQYGEALKWFRLAAEQGEPRALCNLAYIYRRGRVLPQDYKEAIRLLQLAAEKAYAQAQFDLGDMYTTGRGVPQDEIEATKWYRLAANQDHAEAQVALGYRYEEGRGVEKDKFEAVHWFKRAAFLGNLDAKRELKNRGFPVD